MFRGPRLFKVFVLFRLLSYLKMEGNPSLLPMFGDSKPILGEISRSRFATNGSAMTGPPYFIAIEPILRFVLNKCLLI